VAKLTSTIAVLTALSGVTAPVALAHVDIASNQRGDQVLVDHVLFQLARRPLYAATRAPGGSYGPLTPITPADASYTGQAFVDDAGGTLAVVRGLTFAGYQPTPVAAQLLTRPPDGTFGEDAELPFGDNGTPRLAAGERGDAILSWSEPQGPGYYRFRPAGGPLGPSTPLPGKSPSASFLSVEPDGTAEYLWRESAATAADTHTFESERPPGGDFGPPAEVEGVPAFAELTAATAPNGRQLVVWPGRGTIRGVERQPQGEFGAAFTLAHSPVRSLNINSVDLADSGAASLVFGDVRVFLVARDPGSSFEKPRQIAKGAKSALHPIARVDDGGDVAVAWFTAHRRVFATYRPAGGTAQPPRLIGSEPPAAPPPVDQPGLAIDVTGRATVAWEESDGTTIRTLARDFDAPLTRPTATVGALPSVTRQGPPEACRPQGARVLLATAEATVFSSGGSLSACLLARGAPVPLTTMPEESTQPVEAMALAGPFVAYARDFIGHGDYDTSMVVTDLRDPDSGLNRGFSVAGPYDGAHVVATRLKQNGAVAWIDCPHAIETTRERCAHVGASSKYVFAWGATAEKPRRLDHGRRIDPRSFKLRGSRLTWRKRGKLRHATLR
jgi:hypothetical protein